MFKRSSLPAELDFLHEIIGDRKQLYQSASWLKSQFKDNIWKCDLGKNRRFTLDFRIRLDDGRLLTEPHHNDLLITFKSWLCAQTSLDATGGLIISEATAYERITRTLKLIDYFLLNAERFSLAKYGLAIVTEGDLKTLLSDLASSSESSESIYRWNEKLAQYLKKVSNLLNKSEQDEVLNSQLFMNIIDIDESDRVLQLSDNELIKARIYLWRNNLYLKGYVIKNYQFGPNTKALSSIIYRNTLWGLKSKPVPEDLCLGFREHYYHEYLAVPVITNGENQLGEKTMSHYRAALRNLGLLEEIGLSVPVKAIDALSQKNLDNAINLKSVGRFRTLPQNVVFPSLKNAIEFVMKFGDELIDSYLNLLKMPDKLSVNLKINEAQRDIRNVIRPIVRQMGVSTWSLSGLMSTKEYNIKCANQIRQASTEYFRRYRSNEGLYELLRVLYGCIQISVGTLTARRQAELGNLIAGKCLDRTQKYLVFYNRKTGSMGMREKEARPIPEVAVMMIRMLERLQAELIELKLLKKQTYLFARPDLSGRIMSEVGGKYYNSALDAFCDYFETPLNTKNQRYYIRQHQLRRFFAMLFFWGRAFGGMETLRWFLGHASVEHLYHYITESTSGEVLRGVKAAYAGNQIREQSNEADALAELLQKHFGTRQFSVLDAEELDQYIEFLLEENKVEIEPEFFETPQGQNYRILIKVKGLANELRPTC